MLLDKDGHVFVSNKKRGSKVYWSCCRFKSHKCPARASTNDNYVTYWKDSHNHENMPYNPNRFTTLNQGGSLIKNMMKDP